VLITLKKIKEVDLGFMMKRIGFCENDGQPTPSTVDPFWMQKILFDSRWTVSRDPSSIRENRGEPQWGSVALEIVLSVGGPAEKLLEHNSWTLVPPPETGVARSESPPSCTDC